MDSRQNGSGKSRKAAQATITSFWSKFIEKTPTRVTTVFPPSLYADLLPPVTKNAGSATSRNAAESYETAAQECKERVEKIVKECRRRNEKFTDSEFDLERDFGVWNCLYGLIRSDSGNGGGPDAQDLRSGLSTLLASGVLGSEANSSPLNLVALHRLLSNPGSAPSRVPESVHRVDWIFDDPHFVIDGFSNSDIMQGANGDCWWLAAVAILCSVEGVIDKVCVARDEECGVYGFVFYRDGEWIWTVVDDSLYLKDEDFDSEYDPEGKKELKYKKQFQTGSEALYYAKSSDENETWLPLLEKAFAKIHGDYDAIQGGISGEAVEDMTGGVTSRIATDKILSKDRLWKELLNENKEFLFAASSRRAKHGGETARGGIVVSHAFSILKAVEETGEDGKKVRLVQIRNPWGRRGWDGVGEYEGPWSDGSREWTPYWMQKLDHKFGDDGIFWMSYPDLLKWFRSINRTRLFNNEWHVVQKWTTVNVSWVTGYQKHKFTFKVTEKGQVVIVLSQLDTRYFKGLEGQYEFVLHFILRKIGGERNEEVIRARDPEGHIMRSISAEVDLEPGDYEVVPKIVAYRDEDLPFVEDVVKEYAEKNPQKLRQIGINHDIANAKGIKPEEPKKEDEVKAIAKADGSAKDDAKKEEIKEDTKAENGTSSTGTTEPSDTPTSEDAAVQTTDTKSATETEDTKKTETVTTADAKPDSDEVPVEQSTDKPAEAVIDITVEVKPEATKDIPILPSKPPVQTPIEIEIVKNKPAESGTVDKSGASNEKPAIKEKRGEADESHPEKDGQARNEPQDQGAQDEDEESPQDGKGIRISIQEELDSDDDDDHGVDSPWNAVCVLGLRIYSKSSYLTIELAEAKPEDAASLEVGDKTPAGATS